MYGQSLFPSGFFEHNSQRDEGQDFLDWVQIRNKVHIFGTDINIQRKQIDLGVSSLVPKGVRNLFSSCLILFKYPNQKYPGRPKFIHLCSVEDHATDKNDNQRTIFDPNKPRYTDKYYGKQTYAVTYSHRGHLSGYNVNTGIINDQVYVIRSKTIKFSVI